MLTTISNQYEFIAGTPIKVGLTFTDEITGQLSDPDSVTLGIQQNGQEPLLVGLGDFTKTGTGLYFYVFDSSTGTGNFPRYFTAQVASIGALVTMSLPEVFTVLAPSIDGLT